MTEGIALPVDHAVAVVPDLPAAAAAMQGLGFQVTPLAPHSAQMGTWNCCVMLPGAYLELIAVRQETPFNAGWRQLLTQGGGLRGLALRGTALEQDAAALAAAGIPCSAPLGFARQLPGDEEPLRFTILRLEQEQPADLRLLYCRHETPELLWKPAMLDHANGAQALLRVTLASGQVGAAEALLRRLAQIDRGTQAMLPVSVGAAPGELALGLAGPRMDISAAVQAQGLPLVEQAGALVLQPSAALPFRLRLEVARP